MKLTFSSLVLTMSFALALLALGSAQRSHSVESVVAAETGAAAAFWRIDLVDGSGNVGLHSSLVIDVEGQPHISYFDASGVALRYARLGASG